MQAADENQHADIELIVQETHITKNMTDKTRMYTSLLVSTLIKKMLITVKLKTLLGSHIDRISPPC